LAKKKAPLPAGSFARDRGGAAAPEMPSSKIAVPLRGRPLGKREALDALVPVVYDELWRIAHAQLEREETGHTLDTGGLVHEVYLRLVDVTQVEWGDRAHFLAMASRVMRRVLIDYARSRKRAKRGGGRLCVTLSEADGVSVNGNDELLALADALDLLEQQGERRCRVVEYRFFGGLSLEETAAALNTSVATVKRDWEFCRAWLNREMARS
jgi:RNA polymerase sigma factor (TIGR02999 family)